MPRSLIGVYVVAALAVTAGFAMGSIFLALGAQIARDVVGTTDVLLVGAVLSISYLTIGGTAVVASRFRPRASIFAGAVAALTGLALLLASAELHSLGIFVAAAVVCGMGYGLSMSGGIGLASINAPAHHRGRLLSAVFLVAYLVQGAIAFGAGLTATHSGLQHAIGVFVPVIGGLCLASLIAVTVMAARSRATSARAAAAGVLTVGS